MRILKRNNEATKFEESKIENAILKAMKYGSGIYNEELAKKIATEIKEECEIASKIVGMVTVRNVEDMVYSKLIKYNHKLTAKAYEGYRAVQSFKREVNTTDDSILGLLNRTNEEVMNENSNKNGMLASTQRDLIAGEISKDIARRKLIPAHIVQAHDEGVLHYHDLDYSMQSIFNCFSGDTEFISNLGVFRFNECNDGQKVEVIDKNGSWRKATVRKYGKQRLQTITMTSGRTTRVIRATKNHRWLLKNGNITTDLKVGDKLHLLNETNINTEGINNDLFCFGFILGDGNDYDNGNSSGVRTRLCGEKVNLLDKFIEAGYTVSKYKINGSNDILLTKSTKWSKNEFLNSKAWRYMNKEDKISLFKGYYSADGFKDRNGIATSNDNLALMIREISALAGYHITSEKFEIRNTNYKQNAKLYTFRFMKSQPTNKNWIIKDINTDDKHLYDVWCVEEPITNTFTLNGGVVTGNCCLINLEDMLQNGTVINNKMVEKPKSFETACTIVTQIIAQIASSQYGGNSMTIKHIAPFLRDTYDKYYLRYVEEFGEETACKLAEDRMMEQLKNGIQTIRYQLSTLSTSNGQSPFSTIYLEIEEGHKYEKEMALICEEMIRQRLEGMKNYKGQEIGEEFPKLVYLLDEHNCLEGGKYDYVTKLSAKCNTRRLVPDYQSAKIMRQNYDGETFPPMGCRSHLSNWKDENGNYKWYGRFNCGVISLNLVQVALTANKDMDRFWNVLDERLELCKEALLVRRELLKGTLSDVSPIHWQHGAIARLEKGETIDKLLENGYSTLSLGYVGVYEMTQAMLGVSHTTEEGKEFALKVMNHLNDTCQKWKKETGFGFGLYGTPKMLGL